MVPEAPLPREVGGEQEVIGGRIDADGTGCEPVE